MYIQPVDETLSQGDEVVYIRAGHRQHLKVRFSLLILLGVLGQKYKY
jgi:hypothetical protein